MKKKKIGTVVGVEEAARRGAELCRIEDELEGDGDGLLQIRSIYSSLIGCTSCIVKSFRSRRFFISSPVWTP